MRTTIHLLIIILLFGASAIPAVASTKNNKTETALQQQASAPVEVEGITVTPNVYSKELRYWKAPSKKPGALIRIVLTNRDTKNAINLKLRFNGKSPAELLSSKEWLWYDMPENKRADGKPYLLGPGKTEVFTFNGHDSPWSIGSSFKLSFTDADRVIGEQVISIAQGSVEITQATFLGPDNSIYADNMIIHAANNSSTPVKVKNMQLYIPESDGMLASMTANEIDPFPDAAQIPSKERGGVKAQFSQIPLVRGLVRVNFEDASGKEDIAWAFRYFGKQTFHIGSGWIDFPTEKGVVPTTLESYHKLLKIMYVNTAYIGGGYASFELYNRYPLKFINNFGDIESYNSDE